jgi:multiple sugar transport system substrate-binding protein
LQSFVGYLTAVLRFIPGRLGGLARLSHARGLGYEWAALQPIHTPKILVRSRGEQGFHQVVKALGGLVVCIALLSLQGCGQARPDGAGGGQASQQAEHSSTSPALATPLETSRPGAPTRTPGATATPPLPTPTRSITVSPEALRGQVIQFWHPYTGEAQVLLDLMTQEFNRTNPWGIQVENTALPLFADLENRLRSAADSGEMPDVWTSPTYQALQLDADGAVVADLSPYINDPEYGLSLAEQQDFLPALWDQEHVPPPALKGRSNPQGKQLGLPWVRNGVFLLYNRTWGQALGFPSPPESIVGFRDQACAAARFNATDQDRQNDGTGGWMVSGEPAELSGWLYAFGAQFSRPDGRGYQFDSPEARQALEFLDQLAAQGCLWVAGEARAADMLAGRRALFTVASLVDLPAVRAELAQQEASDVWQILAFPSPVSQPAVVSHGFSLILAQTDAQRQLAGWLYMRWLVSTPNQARWAQFNYLIPTRRSALEGLQSAAVPNQDWVDALGYQPYLRAEPYYVSWQRVRWALGDALIQLVAPQPQALGVVEVLKMLDELAAEVHLQIR